LRSEPFARVDDVLRRAAGRLCTAIVARIERGGKLVFERAYGVTRADAAASPVYVDTRFDLASLTKLVVSTLALFAIAQGRLGLDEPVSAWLPQWRGSIRETITLRMLLAHTSGMDSGADYRMLLDRNVAAAALELPLLASPGERVIYSDLGMIALGEVLARAEDRSLQHLVARLRRPALAYVPHARERRAIPATEEDAWRGRVQGFVHDEKAFLMNGVAGHAGLFGTAADVAWLAEQYLTALRTHGDDAASALFRDAVTEQAYDPVLRRGLGWALKTSDKNSCGRGFSPASFGHTGFTGTCVWADPHRDVQGVLLTNTVYFGRADSWPLRTAFYEALASEVSAA
jgi:CubicO group peptidase (beta-lactamase class C family)